MQINETVIFLYFLLYKMLRRELFVNSDSDDTISRIQSPKIIFHHMLFGNKRFLFCCELLKKCAGSKVSVCVDRCLYLPKCRD